MTKIENFLDYGKKDYFITLKTKDASDDISLSRDDNGIFSYLKEHLPEEIKKSQYETLSEDKESVDPDYSCLEIGYTPQGYFSRYVTEVSENYMAAKVVAEGAVLEYASAYACRYYRFDQAVGKALFAKVKKAASDQAASETAS